MESHGWLMLKAKAFKYWEKAMKSIDSVIYHRITKILIVDAV